MNKYQKRWENAKKIANLVNSYLDTGHVVLDENGDSVQPFNIEFDTIFIREGSKSTVHYFCNDRDMDEGLYTPIKEYSKQFKKWIVLKKTELRVVP